MKILVTEAPQEIKTKLLDYMGNSHEIVEFGEAHDSSDIEGAMIRSKTIVDEKFLSNYPNLKHIFRVGVGLDKVDLKLCKEKGITVHNTPNANSDSVADLVVGAIIYGSRKLGKSFTSIEDRFDYMGNEIDGQKVGIVGFGNIGKKVYSRLEGFGIDEFIIYDPYVSEADLKDYTKARLVENIDTLYKVSDIITFHVPLLPATKNLLGKNTIPLLKNDTLIINCARGGIIDESELIVYLQNNPSSFYFADVWEKEPGKPKNPLVSLENVKITPHIGAMTREAEIKMHYFPYLESAK